MLLFACGLATGTSISNAFDDEASSCVYRQIVHNAGSRSEYVTGHLTCHGQELAGELGRVVTSTGEYSFVSSVAESWQPAGSPGWMPQSEVTQGAAQQTTAQASDGTLTFSAEELQRGWYFGAFTYRRASTPATWVYSVTRKFWFDPARPEKINPLLRAMRELENLVKAVEQYQAKVGHYPGDLKLLVIGPAAARDWQPLVAADALIDPWGTSYKIELFARSQAREHGLMFKITSLGDDRASGTADDLSAPRPVNPRPPAIELREDRMGKNK
jgi:hypothetical protein